MCVDGCYTNNVVLFEYIKHTLDISPGYIAYVQFTYKTTVIILVVNPYNPDFSTLIKNKGDLTHEDVTCYR
jgi:hypothetical protein